MAAIAVEFAGVTKVFTLKRDRARSFKELFVRTVNRQAGDEAERLVALDDVSFSLEQGGTLGLVGPNGTGKSTILKLAARILEPTSGVVRVRGRVAALLELGAGFHPDLSGRENVYLNGSLMGLDRSEMGRRLERIVEFAELSRFIDMPVKHYSSGMYMRLGFATAIHVDPEILLVDEVLAVGDQAFQNKCRDRIARLRREGITLVLVSHDIQAVRDLCQRALWLEDGSIQAYGPTDEVVERYYRSVAVHEESRLAAEEGRTEQIPIESSNHWGSGEVRIVDVEFLGGDGEVRHVFHTGEDLTIRLRYEAHQPIPRPVFGLGIHRQDGLHIAGPNTKEAGLQIPFVDGPGCVELLLPSLPLMEATYELSASVYDWDLTRPYDYHHRRYVFHVRAEHLSERIGAFHVPGEWSHQSGAGDDRAQSTPTEVVAHLAAPDAHKPER